MCMMANVKARALLSLCGAWSLFEQDFNIITPMI
jgi:hypothetical protein